ncbi:MAG: glycerophosphodiester phosphodiesterase, partial [Actinomycetota bacterium]|nr:glycerophosphodiester phosphodiesterase [Actinomycetota bacterium]
MAIRAMSRSETILGTGSTAGQGKVGTGSSFSGGSWAPRLFSEDAVQKFVLMPACGAKKWKTVAMASAPTVIAHRGAREAAQENTLPAFRLAREFGAEWVELDARRTADGVVVV